MCPVARDLKQLIIHNMPPRFAFVDPGHGTTQVKIETLRFVEEFTYLAEAWRICVHGRVNRRLCRHAHVCAKGNLSLLYVQAGTRKAQGSLPAGGGKGGGDRTVRTLCTRYSLVLAL